MGPKPKERTRRPPDVSLEDLFSTLHRHILNFEFDKVVKVADQVLAISPRDEDTVRCKIVALIKSDAIDKALTVIQASKDLPIDLNLYRAYCLYRQNKLQEALESLAEQERTPAVLQLESQILYRLGKMDACINVYEKLQNFKIESSDLKTNIVAALISAGRAFEVQKTMETLRIKASNSFEIAYNTACSLIEMKKFKEAEQQLLSARRIGQEMLMEEDYADDEIENELVPIAVQLAFVQQLMGQTQQAIGSYTDIIKSNIVDAPSLAVATNNLIALKGTKEISDSLRKVDRLIEKTSGQKHFQLANGLDFKLFPRQKEAIYSNRLLLLLQTNKMDQARELATVLTNMFPGSLTPIILQAAVSVKDKKVAKAEEILGFYSDKYPEKSKPILLARAQIAAAAGHFQISTESLSRISDIQHQPATVATVVSLNEQSGDLGAAFAALDSAIQWWKDAMTEDNKLDAIMKEAASFKVKHGHVEEALDLYEKLVACHSNTESLVGLVTTAAHVDIDKAECYEKQLKPLSGMKGINVKSLMSLPGPRHVIKPQTSEEVKKSKTKKRKRKPRYPKGFDPANPGPPPDPERWLPKRERSSYRPRRKDRRAQVRGSQGAVVSREKHDAASVANTSNNPGDSRMKSVPGDSRMKSVPANAGSSKVGSQSATVSKPKAVSSKSRKKFRS